MQMQNELSKAYMADRLRQAEQERLAEEAQADNWQPRARRLFRRRNNRR